ncbi:hypothetical protein ABZ446_45730 [Streptomyces sp. NPDC005813]|uniref:hypothetical protein n=1 Tax=Streptomyces sp. NPDC005813 TaxID=3155592 RepID=UPI003406A57B
MRCLPHARTLASIDQPASGTDNILDAEGKLVDALDLMSMLSIADGKIVCSRDYFFDSRKFTDAWGSQRSGAVARGYFVEL